MTATIIYDQTERLLQWAGPRNDAGTLPAETRAIGLERAGEIIAVVYYNAFTEHNCAIHVASNGKADWLSRRFLSHVFAYPFVQLKLRRVTAYVAESNERALSMDWRLGFRVEGKLEQAAGDEDLIVMGMLRQNCLWIPEVHRHG